MIALKKKNLIKVSFCCILSISLQLIGNTSFSCDQSFNKEPMISLPESKIYRKQ